PPGLIDVWNNALTGRSAAPLTSTSLLEHLVLAKPYFDPAGLLVALDGDRMVGFGHAAFGPNENETGVCHAAGVLCMVAVRTSHRRKGVGSELLRRCEAYLQAAGARSLSAGNVFPGNPFYFGLYGGSQSAGFLESDRTAGPFLGRHGYRVGHT